MENLSSVKKRRTFTVALVGADGSGKTTVANYILNNSIRPMKRIYLGPAVSSSDQALFTTRIAAWFKRRSLRGSGAGYESTPPPSLMTAEQRKRLSRGRIFKALGLVNRIMEEWYRQFIVMYHKLRGRIVICDRHFIYEYGVDLPSQGDEILSVRLHTWHLRNLYPRPELTLFLDAPTDVLYQRKPEWPEEYLQEQRDKIIAQGKYAPNFVIIDVSQPLEKVISAAEEIIERFASGEPVRDEFANMRNPGNENP